MPYAYNADIYCDSCGEDIASTIHAPANMMLDSDTVPVWFAGGESDTPNHCASGEDCLEALDLTAYGPIPELHGAESRTIGAWIEEDLTEYGVEYLREMLDPGELHYTRGIGSDATHTRTLTPYQAALHAFWREVYADLL